MKNLKKIMCSAIATLSLAVCAVTPFSDTVTSEKSFSIINTLEAEAAEGRLYNQNDSKWASVKFRGYSGDMKSSGCGIFSFCNAIYALNGKKADAQEVGQWAVNVGAFKPGSGGTYREPFYNKVQNAYGSRLGFKVDGQYWGSVTNSRLINHLRNGGVAVIHVPSHFMAITGYSNGNYHVIESASRLPGDSWQSANKLSSGNTKVDWFVLLSRTSSPAPNPVQPVQNNNSYFARYTGSSGSIVEGLKAIGVDSSMSYRKSIASANNISNYSGTAQQNQTLMNLLKNGQLKKPGSSSGTSVTVNYFPKYTGSSGSIVDALRAVGADTSFSYRQKIAEKNGISNYAGNASQNSSLLSKLKSGNLIKP
ncbi:MAG: DUF3597 domain-containing protein [Ruminococcus sp.]|nr:DUF3597 domain-containing protein [Ruminococcus sp.]